MKIFPSKRDKSYISAVDRFQLAFNKQHSPSAYQLAEIEKYRRIALLRDKAKPKPADKS